MTIARPIARPLARGVADYGVTLPDGFGGAAPASEPAEFITNGGMDSSANYTLNGWTISGGVATNTISGISRTLKQDFGALAQPLISGNDYVLTFTGDNTVGVSELQIFVDLNDASGQIFASAPSTGANSIPFTASSNATHVRFNTAIGESTGLIIDNLSLAPAP